MEDIIFQEIKEFEFGLVDSISKLEKRNLGKDASINQWVIPVIIRYGKLIVAKINSSDNIIGVCEIIRNWGEDSTAFIHSFYIDRKYRNKSIGKKLLQKAISILRRDGFMAVELTVDPGNEIAGHLYEKFGFKKIGNRKNEYGKGIDRNLMRLELV
jgi:ribosomal protein S18 acetylase RimI-like enzyme